MQEPPNAPKYYEYMGRVMCTWGRLEVSFTTDLIWMAGLPIVAPLFKPFPLMWKRKLQNFHKCFSCVDELRPLESAAAQFVNAGMLLADKRNIVAHGSFWSFNDRDPLEAEFEMIKIDKGSINLKRYACTLTEMKELIIETDDLNTRYVVLSSEVARICNNIKMNRPQLPKNK